MERKKSKYFLLYLKTGGGHLAPARSVAEHICSHHPGTYDPVLIDGFEKSPRIIRFLVEDGYRTLQARAKWYFALIYALHKFPPIAHFSRTIVALLVTPYLRERILTERPEKIIIFHFLLTKPVSDILRRYNLAIPTITVVTDPFTAHPMWFLQRDQHYIVFSELLKEHCIQREMHEGQISVFPFILNDRFSHPLPPGRIAETRQRLGFSAQKKLILIFGGGDGMPKGDSIMERLVRSHPAAEIAIVCGRNTMLFQKATRLKERYPGHGIFVFGFVDFTYELINISDIVITKCGASSFMEVLLSGKIPIINNYLWEQEKGNVEFVMQHGLGIYERRLRRLPGIIHSLIDNAGLASRFEANFAEARLENGTPRVSRFILDFGRT
jgi:processive 1,2-diacylglycerol beta-glucosyltransferase/1,2-diacylglycerol 3-beta-galactosyltransferase